jgi:hypothetical protein
MLLKVFSAASQDWMYYKLPNSFKVGHRYASQEWLESSDALTGNGQKLDWVFRNELKKEDTPSVALCGFDVLFTTPESYEDYCARRQEDISSHVFCKFVSWLEDGAIEGVGIMGYGYILNEDGKTIEKV